MKLIRKLIFVFVIITSIVFANTKSRIKKTIKSNEEAIDSDLIFLENLYTLDSSIKNNSHDKEIIKESGFKEFDNPVTKINKQNDRISSNYNDQENLKDEQEDKFAVKSNSSEDLMDVEKESFEDHTNQKTEENYKQEENIFMEVGVTATANTSDAEFFKNKLNEINKFEEFLFDQEKILEQKSRELLERTKSFLK